MNINDNFMQWPDVCKAVNRTKVTVWRWVQLGVFPKPVYRKVDGNFIGFRREDVEHYCNTGEVLVRQQ